MTLFKQAVDDARTAFAGRPLAVIFDLPARADITSASRGLTETVSSFEADFAPFVERIKLIGEPGEPCVVIDMQAAKDALLGAVVGLRVIEGGKGDARPSCGGRGPAAAGCSCFFCVQYFATDRAQA